jgi:anti-sigma factor RsiW
MTVEHLRLRESIGAYVLGQLEPSEELELEDHLAHCGPCRTEEEELRPIAELLRSADLGGLGQPDVTIDLEPPAVPPRQTAAWPRLAAALTAAAAVVAVALVFFPEPRPIGLGVEEPIAFTTVPEDVAAAGTVVAHTWGTEVRLEVEGLPAGRTYTVLVEPVAGPPVVAGTMLGVDDRLITCALNGAVLRERARAVLVTDGDGATLMRSEL